MLKKIFVIIVAVSITMISCKEKKSEKEQINVKKEKKTLKIKKEHIKKVVENTPKMIKPSMFQKPIAFDKKLRDRMFVSLYKKNNDVVKKIFEKGLNVNAPEEKTGYTAYVVAAKTCNIEIMRYLDKKNADHSRMVMSGNDAFKSAFLNAAINGCLNVVKYMIEHREADINMHSKIWKETALFKAAKFNHSKMAQYLLKKGADKSIENNSGLSPVDIAKLKKNQKLVEILSK